MREAIYSLDFILASNREENLRRFLSQCFPSWVTCYVVVDTPEMEAVCREYKAIPIPNPNKELGYYGLHEGYNKALEVSSGDMVFLATDELLFGKPVETFNKLQDDFNFYFAEYPDAIFKLKTGFFRHHKHVDRLAAIMTPDNYAFYTREWMTAVGGFGEFWGPDSWLASIDFFNNHTIDPISRFGFYREFCLDYIKYTGGWAGLTVNTREESEVRKAKIKEGWKSLLQTETYKKFIIAALKLRNASSAYKGLRINIMEHKGIATLNDIRGSILFVYRLTPDEEVKKGVMFDEVL